MFPSSNANEDPSEWPVVHRAMLLTTRRRDDLLLATVTKSTTCFHQNITCCSFSYPFIALFVVALEGRWRAKRSAVDADCRRCWKRKPSSASEHVQSLLDLRLFGFGKVDNDIPDTKKWALIRLQRHGWRIKWLVGLPLEDLPCLEYWRVGNTKVLGSLACYF